MGSSLGLTLGRLAEGGRIMRPLSHHVADVAEHLNDVWHRLLAPPEPNCFTVHDDECPC